MSSEKVCWLLASHLFSIGQFVLGRKLHDPLPRILNTDSQCGNQYLDKVTRGNPRGHWEREKPLQYIYYLASTSENRIWCSNLLSCWYRFVPSRGARRNPPQQGQNLKTRHLHISLQIGGKNDSTGKPSCCLYEINIHNRRMHIVNICQ